MRRSAFHLGGRHRGSAAVAASETTAWGSLVTRQANISAEQGAGMKVAMFELNWAAWETSDGAWSSSYQSTMRSWYDALVAAGYSITLSFGAHYTPNWLRSSGQLFVGENGALSTGCVDFVWDAGNWAHFAAYVDHVDSVFPLSGFDAIRISSLSDGELLYPGSSSSQSSDGSRHWWFYGPAPQQGTDLVAGQTVCPSPGWTAGGSDPSMTTTQVQSVLTWYLQSMTNLVTRVQDRCDGLGFTGWYEVLMSGSGARPSTITSLVSAHLSPVTSIATVGPVWQTTMALLPKNGRTTAHLSSVGDRSGSDADDVYGAGDAAVSLTDTRANGWSATRWGTYLAKRNGLPVTMENSGWSTGFASHYTDLESSGLLAAAMAAAAVSASNPMRYYWAHSDRLASTSNLFPAFSSAIDGVNSPRTSGISPRSPRSPSPAAADPSTSVRDYATTGAGR